MKFGQTTEPGFFSGFVNPPAEGRPFVRWWWNGNHLEEDGIIRQLDALENAGLNWYGKPVFNIEKAVITGENLLEIKYTTVLSNYAMSLENNPTARRWTNGFEKIPVGLAGEVVLLSDAE